MGYKSVTPSLSPREERSRQTQRYTAGAGAELLKRTQQRAHVEAKVQVSRGHRAWGNANADITPLHGADERLIAWREKSLAITRVAFGCLWGIDAWFKWQPAFADNFLHDLTPSVAGLAPMLNVWLTFWFQVASLQPHLFASFLAAGETGIAVCLICGAFTNMACGAGMLLTLITWSIVDGLGGVFGRGSIDSGVFIVYMLVCLGLMLSNAGQYMGVDRSLAHRLGRWTFLAAGSLKQA